MIEQMQLSSLFAIELKAMKPRMFANMISAETLSSAVSIKEHPGFGEIRLIGTIGEDIIYEDIKAGIDSLLAKNYNEILLSIDTPGGEVYESETIDDLLANYEESGVNFTVFSQRMLTSAGYLISAKRSKIYLAPPALTGSIGAILMFPTYQKMLEMAGIKWNIFVSGKNKILADSKDLTTEQTIEQQLSVEKAGEMFLEHVISARGLDPALKEELKNASIYKAKEALKLGLIDGIMSKEEVIKELSNSIDSGNMLLINTVTDQKKAMEKEQTDLIRENAELQKQLRAFQEKEAERKVQEGILARREQAQKEELILQANAAHRTVFGENFSENKRAMLQGASLAAVEEECKNLMKQAADFQRSNACVTSSALSGENSQTLAAKESKPNFKLAEKLFAQGRLTKEAFQRIQSTFVK